MAASAIPNGNHHGNSSTSGVSSTRAKSVTNGNSESLGILHTPEPGICTDWTPEELRILDDGLSKLSSLSPVMMYAKIAKGLPNKTVRDVAFRLRLTNKKEVGKRRKEDPPRKSKYKRERVAEPSSRPSHAASRPVNHPSAVPSFSIDDDGISCEAIGGSIGEIFEQNVQAFQRISANFSSYMIQENIPLLCQARDNIIKVSKSLDDALETMHQMPPLPVKVKEELANSILPSTSHPS